MAVKFYVNGIKLIYGRFTRFQTVEQYSAVMDAAMTREESVRSEKESNELIPKSAYQSLLTPVSRKLKAPYAGK